MKVLKSILSFYVFSNIHVAIAGYCLTRITQVIFNMEPSVLPWFVGLAIVVSYNLIRMTDRGEKPDSWISTWLSKNKTSVNAITGISLLGMGLLLLFSHISLYTVLVLLPFALMTFFYAIPIMKVRGKVVSLRRIPGAKIFSIGLAWAGVTVLVPFVESDFHIRDMKLDIPTLDTMPQRLGLLGSKWVGYSLVVVFVMVELYQQKSINREFVITTAVGLVIAYCLLRSNPARNKFFTSFWVEGIPIVWFVLISVFLNS
jgi:hypothetical protein